MLAEFQISDEDIAHAESVLLPAGAQFDDERRGFIRCFSTADLQAVPGSGKTTALLAKLVVLDRHLSFSDPGGILVISHTNAAVNEIRDKIGKICPRIFGYPNFVGTIQSFVDTFLAIPSFVRAFGFRPVRIDADAYNSEILRRSQNLHQGAKSWIARRNDPERLVQNLRFDSELNLTKGLDGAIVLKSASASNAYKSLANLKQSMFKSGLLHFEDIFWFANQLLKDNVQPKTLIQRRFQIVFVDEMQDMATHQHEILETVFGPGSGADTIFQRIGDSDQAIFGGNNILDAGEWEPRKKMLALSNSLRLSAPIASILPPFAYEKDNTFKIIGLQGASILPHILLYDDDSISMVVERYAQLIAELQAEGSILQDGTERFMAVAWNCVRSESSNPQNKKLRLVDFCPTFSRATSRKQQEFETLADYLYCFDTDDRTLGGARNGILRAICNALRLDEVVDPRSDKPFTPRSLMSYFRFEVSETGYSRIRRLLLKWSVNLAEGKPEETLSALREFIPKLVQHLGGGQSNSADFLAGEQTVINANSDNNDMEPNCLNFGEVKIGLGTVHSVKGQTHTATLYIESAYQNDGGKKYESQRLAAQFKGERLPANAGKHVKESAKMVYVGFSRPTHLLVFAVHKDNFESCLSDIDTSMWKIIHAYGVEDD